MSFTPIYYCTLCCPTAQRTLEMIDQYVAHGAKAVQVDIPSSAPVFETEFVKEMMANALGACSDSAYYVEVLRTLRRRQPLLELHIVVYPDAVDWIGFEQFLLLYGEVAFSSVMIAGGDEALTAALGAAGCTVIGRIDRNLPPQQIQVLKGTPANAIYNFNYKRHREVVPHGLQTFQERIGYLRASGVSVGILAVEGISNRVMMEEVRDAGADGALVGNALMRLWNQPDALWRLFDDFQSVQSP